MDLEQVRAGLEGFVGVELHRTGQRRDPVCEHNARSVMPMFERAQRLVG